VINIISILINIKTIFNKSVVERYKIINVVREQHNNNNVKKSLIQEELNKAGVVDDIFSVCDVAYANVREDLTFVDRTKDQIFYSFFV
jgi:rRNA processing protein Gar1